MYIDQYLDVNSLKYLLNKIDENFIKNTDIATNDDFGVIKIDNMSILTNNNGSLSISDDFLNLISSLNLVINDEINNKQKAINALNRRGCNLSNDSSFDEITNAIENMEYGEGILSKIGYESPEDYPVLLNEINKAYNAKLAYESGEIDTLKDCGTFAPKVAIKDGNADYLFSDKTNTSNTNTNLIYVPKLEGIKSAKYMFKNCTSLKELPPLDYSTIENAERIFGNCSSLQSVKELNFNNTTNANRAFERCGALNNINGIILGDFVSAEWLFNLCRQLESVVGIDVGGVYSADYFFWNCTSLSIIKVENIGKSYHMWDFSPCLLWGTTNEESRESVIYTLLTHSYDRAANGLSVGTITLHANTKAILTEEEIAAITAKGYTIV